MINGSRGIVGPVDGGERVYFPMLPCGCGSERRGRLERVCPPGSGYQVCFNGSRGDCHDDQEYPGRVLEWLVPGETLALWERVAGKSEGECSAYPGVACSEKDPLSLHDRLSRTNGAGGADGVPPFDEKVLSVCF